MTATPDPDLAACRSWRASVALGPARVGIIPDWNAVTLLNPAAAAIWDLLIETGDIDAATQAYARRVPTRANAAQADVNACLAAWQAQGLFAPPAPTDEALRLRALTGTLADRGTRRGPAPAFHRDFLIRDVPVALDVEDAALAAVVADLLADFPGTDRPPRHVLRATGPEDGWVLYQDDTPVRLAQNLPMARGQIVAELVRLAGGDTGWRATVHGAVLGSASGAVFLAGASGAGKSTLSAGLIARGWRLLAEDIAAFGDQWRVHPLPFALSIKDGAVDILAPDYPGLSAARRHRLGPRWVRYQGLPTEARATEPQTPRLFLDVRYDAEMGTAPAELERLTEIEALGLFLNEESYIGFERADTASFFDFVARTPAYRLRYGHIATAERAIRDGLDTDGRSDTERTPANDANT